MLEIMTNEADSAAKIIVVGVGGAGNNAVNRMIDENISDPNLSPEQLSSALGVSRSKLYRELKRIDGYSLSDYVRNVRLEKAAYLLVNSHLNIQEIMNEVGFINSSHFTKVFKLKYDMTPSEYKRNT